MRLRFRIVWLLVGFCLGCRLPVAHAADEPTFSEILQAALRQEQLERAPLEQMGRRMRVAPWLPTLYAGYDLSLRAASAVSITDNISVSGSGVTVGPDDNDWDRSVNRGDVLHFKAIWNLSELMFHPSELALAREARALSVDRLKLADYLSKIHAERRKAVAEYRLSPERGSPKALLLREKIRTLTEELNAHTADAFADRWRRH